MKSGFDDEFEIQKRQLPRRRRRGLLFRRNLTRCLIQKLYLRSTNLSIVSRQISRNITDIFRYRTSLSLSLSVFLPALRWLDTTLDYLVVTEAKRYSLKDILCIYF